MALPGKVKTGDPVRASDWNAMIDCVRAAQLSPGSGVRITRTPSGTTLALDKAAIKTVTLPQLPFQVVQISSGDDPTIGVISDSHVINSADKDSYEEDNSDWGLLSDDESDGAFDLPDIGDKIWLQFTFDEARNLTSIDLKYGPVGGDDWDEYPDPIAINTDGDPYQEFYHQIIAEATDPESDPREGFTATANDGTKVKIVQILKTNLTLVPAITTEDADQPNLNIMVTIPSNAPATSDDGSADPITDGSDIKTPWEFGTPIDEIFPFKVQVRSDPDVPGAFNFGVVSDSLLLNTPDYTDDTAIEGLISGDEGWVMWNGADDIVWLEIEWDDWPDSYSASIKSYSNGDDWGGGEVEYDGQTPPTQTKARIVLAEITSDDSGNPVVDQRVRTHLQMVGAMELAQTSDGGDGVTIDCIVPAAFPAADALPEWMQGDGDFDNGYDVWFGDGKGSFVGEQAAPIKCFEIEVQDPQDDSASSMTLLIGDDDGADNDMLSFTYGSEDSQNQILLQWVDYPKLELTNDSDAGLGIYVEDTNPKLLLADVWDDQESGNQINLNLENGPELYLQDDSGNELTVNINDYPIVELDDSEDHTGNQINLNLENGPELYLQDGSGNELSVNINDGPEISLTGEDGASAVLDTGSLTLTDSDGNDTTLSNGDLDLGDDGTIEIGDQGSITVGNSVLSDGDLDLGGDGTIEAGGSTFSPQTFTFLGDDCQWHTIEVLATDQDDTSDATDDIWNMISDNVDDSIRAALDTLSASIDCDSMTVTFSYSY
jgi:hypothetical protein